MEQKKYKQINTKTPEIQEMILSYQIGGVAYELSQRLEYLQLWLLIFSIAARPVPNSTISAPACIS